MQSRTKNVFAEVNIVIRNLPLKLFVDILQNKISSCGRDVKDEIFLAISDFVWFNGFNRRGCAPAHPAGCGKLMGPEGHILYDYT